MAPTFTQEEFEFVHEFVEVYYGIRKTKQPEHDNKYLETLELIRDMISRFGEDGFGNKPADMNRVIYWLQHITE